MLVAAGLTSKEIGRELGLAPSTVDSHVRSAMERLGATNRNSAAKLVSDLLKLPSGESETATARLRHEGQKAWLPPLGGTINHLPIGRRVFHIVQIAMLGIAGMAAAVVTVAGLVNLFGS